MVGSIKITNTSSFEQYMQFFLHVYCPIFQSLLHDRRNLGLSEFEKQANMNFILRMRFLSAGLGDLWWHSWFRRDMTIQARIYRVAELFEEWCAIQGHSESSAEARVSIGNNITDAIVYLGKTYRNNIHLIRHDLDLEQLEADIKYFEALRSLGISALTNAVASAFGEIFGHMRRPPEIFERDKDDGEEKEETPR